ncbi:MAG: hypothetical protein A2073_00865 [Deltaproteobacteria bacterium GWC2_42_11]|nr:MAG: hypothetical protein A2073_00865 [Deltaproteobacteria bacterium GWC2_42_11]HBO83529.1 hypothetical protein [Deltaproteobacteria bacterium]
MEKILYMVLLFAVVFAVIVLAGKLMKKIPSNITRIINRISFPAAALSGILFYLKPSIIPHTPLLYIFGISLILYFISYNYDRGAKK